MIQIVHQPFAVLAYPRSPTPSLLPGTRKEHKGPRSSGIAKKKTAPKQSTQRRELLFVHQAYPLPVNGAFEGQ
jgi:hypothetical protein